MDRVAASVKPLADLSLLLQRNSCSTTRSAGLHCAAQNGLVTSGASQAPGNRRRAGPQPWEVAVYVRDMEFTDSPWPQQSQRFAAGLFASVSRLSHMINEFERALRGTLPADARDLCARIRSARKPLDLWDLRSDVHDLVRKAFDPWEARVRLDDLNCLFDPPRSRGVLSAG